MYILAEEMSYDKTAYIQVSSRNLSEHSPLHPWRQSVGLLAQTAKKHWLNFYLEN